MKSDKEQCHVSDDCISQMMQRIIETVSPERIILFGSHANGTAKPDSDIDFMIIESEPFGPGRSRRKEMTRLWKALRHFPYPKDFLVYSCEEWDQWQKSTNHIIARASREGRVLYERNG